jgi:hypothetical protein
VSTVLSLRPTQTFDLPLSTDVVLLHPEQVILRFGHNKTVDVGSLCFLNREFVRVGRSRLSPDGKRVQLSSIFSERVRHVRKLISQISDEVDHSGLRDETLRGHYSRFIAFMAWADTHGWQHVLANKNEVRAVLSAYIGHLRERVRKMEFTLNSAAYQQNAVVRVLEIFHGNEEVARGLNLLYKDERTKESTKPPCENTQSKVLSLCEALFEGLCELVLTPRPFPYGVNMPQYLGLPDDMLWLFPSNSWFMSPAMLAERHTMAHPGWAYNYAQGRLATLEELRAVNSLPGLANFAGKSDIRRRGMLREARRQLAVANTDNQHCIRRQLAFQAMNTFCNLFLAETGMNWAQLTELSWSDDFEVSPSHQGFRAIKWRAGGKPVSFEIPVSFMPSFKRFLAIRKYLLNGGGSHNLFFKQGSRGWDVPPTPIKSNLNMTYAMLRRIDPTLPAVTSREWRAAKSDWLLRNTDPATTAVVLQNTERTVLRSYAEGSESVHLTEMSNFLNEVASRVLPKDEPVEGGVARAVGICASFGAPSPIAEPSVQPDCKRPEGCLFCEKFKVHADEKDTRKLLSCRYCLRQTAPLTGSDEQINALLGPIFDRIEVILNELHKRDPKMVERVTREVEEDGELDHYWAQKYEMLVSLGVVA